MIGLWKDGRIEDCKVKGWNNMWSYDEYRWLYEERIDDVMMEE